MKNYLLTEFTKEKKGSCCSVLTFKHKLLNYKQNLSFAPYFKFNLMNKLLIVGTVALDILKRLWKNRQILGGARDLHWFSVNF